MHQSKELEDANERWCLARDATALAQINMSMAIKSKRSIVESFQNVMKLTPTAAEAEYQAIMIQHRDELLAAIERLDEAGIALRTLIGREFPD